MTSKRKLEIAKMLATVCWIDATKSACPSLILGHCPMEHIEGDPPCYEVSPQHWLDWMDGKEKNNA